jgi:membrane protease YdiL (CAAX protease family)
MFFCIYNIIVGIVILNYASKNHILKHKNTLIALLVFSILIGPFVYQSLLSIIALIVLICLKRKEPEDFPPVKKKIEKVEYEQNTKPNLKKAIIAILVYAILYSALPRALEALFPNINPTLGLIIGMIIPVAIILITILELFKDELKISLKAIKENGRSYKYLIVKTFFITLGVVAIANFIRFALVGELAENQKSLNEMKLIYIAPLAIIFAPIVEECVFRGSIRKIIKIRYLFIGVSGILFGALHAIGENSIFNFAITTIPYSLMGLSFAYTYEKTNNIMTNILLHFLNNTMAIIAMFLIFGA